MDGGILTPTTQLHELSLVCNFPEPLKAWDPESPANLMELIGGGRFQRCVLLKACETYTYIFWAIELPGKWCSLIMSLIAMVPILSDPSLVLEM